MIRHAIAALAVIVIVTGAPTSSPATARLVDGVLTVDGKPFFPLGSWNFEYTTADDIARLGMNTSFRGASGSPEAVNQLRGLMREMNRKGIQVIPYLSYGGAGVVPWEPAAVREISALSTEPNLLSWYVGDDITMRHLDGIKQTVTILRERTPDVPISADYIAEETPEARTTFTQYIDIRCQYGYPVPNDTLTKYLKFFDDQRKFVGDPLWTWVQNFMWGATARTYALGIQDGPGPIPDPEQVRLLAYAAVIRGVRGILFFPQHELDLQPELAAEVALTCREIRLVSDHLAGGAFTLDLATSNPDLKATSFRYGNSTVVATALYKPTYHRWVDTGIVENATIDVPWPGATLPEASLVAMPDVVSCSVARGSQAGMVRITVPKLELAGLILLSNDRAEINRLKSGVRRASVDLRGLAVHGSIAQVRKVSQALWGVGFGHLYEANNMIRPAIDMNNRALAAFEDDHAEEEVRLWRSSLRHIRAGVDSMMRFAEARRELVPPSQKRLLNSPYSLNLIRNLRNAPAKDDPWNFVSRWLVAGPFPLERDMRTPHAVPPGFERAYPPESHLGPDARFQTIDGPGTWKPIETDISRLADFLPAFGTTDDAVCYAQVRVIAPRDITVTASLGSNDGARAWVNGEVVFSWASEPTGGRGAEPHQDEFPVHLKAGENTLLVKVENLGLNWQLYFSFRDPARELRFATP